MAGIHQTFMPFLHPLFGHRYLFAKLTRPWLKLIGPLSHQNFANFLVTNKEEYNKETESEGYHDEEVQVNQNVKRKFPEILLG